MLCRIFENFKSFELKNAFCINNEFYTYKSLYKKIIDYQVLINKNDINLNPIGIVYSDNIDSYASILAVLFLGKTYVPINPKNPVARNNEIINEAKIKFIINCTNTDFKIDSGIVRSNQLIEANNTNKIIFNYKRDEFAYIFFTSGSTGKPKGVPVYYRNLECFIEAFSLLSFNLNHEDRFLQMFELTFDLSVMSYLIPLYYGATVYTVPDKELKIGETYKILKKHKITFALMVPSVINFLQPYFSQIKLEKLKYCLFCGEALKTVAALEWKRCVPNAKIFNVYGPTEATIFCTIYELSGKEYLKEYNGIISIGRPMNGTSLDIIDIEGEIINIPGNKGELRIKGNQVTDQYLNNKEETRSKFSNNMYRTGDICFFDTDGLYYYIDRVDTQIQIQGYRVELSEIEYHISNFTKNAMNATVSLEKQGNQILFSFVEKRVNENELYGYLKKYLPSYMIPFKIIIIDKMPLNNNGKIDKVQLKQYAEQNI